MPVNITPVAAWTVPVTAPADSDAATGSLFQATAQCHANRAEYLKQQIDQGVPRVRTVSDFAALRALTGVSDGDTAIVADQGVYRFSSIALGTETLPWIVTPTVASGRWRHVLYGIAGTNLATLSGGRVVESVPNRLLELARYVDATNGLIQFVTAGTWTDTGITRTLATTGVTGDIVKVATSFVLDVTGGGTASARVKLTAGGVSQNVDETIREVPIIAGAPTRTSWAVSTQAVLSSGGTLIATVQAMTTAGSANIRGPGVLALELVRP